jgi:hypothetical protein
LVFFVAAQAGLVVMIDRWYPEIREPEFGYRLAQLQKQLATDRRPLVLVLGSSRVELGFVPSALPRLQLADGREPLVFNFGLSASGPLEEALCLHRLLERGIRPTCLLLEVFPPLLGRPGSADEWLGVERLGWSDLSLLRRYISRPMYAYYGQWACSELVPWLGHRSNLLSACAPAWAPEETRAKFAGQQHLFRDQADPLGWIAYARPSVSPVEYRHGLELARREYVAGLRQFQIAPVPDRALRDLLALCRREHIPCLLFLMPEARDFRRWYPPAVEARINAYLAELGHTYEVPLVDARSWAVDADFLDGHHLLAGGARKFTQRFGQTALGPFLLRTAQPMPDKPEAQAKDAASLACASGLCWVVALVAQQSIGGDAPSAHPSNCSGPRPTLVLSASAAGSCTPGQAGKGDRHGQVGRDQLHR